MESKKYKKDEKPAGEIICEPLVKYETIVLDPEKRYSYADYLTWVDDKRRELFDGVVRMMAGPLTVHSVISTNIVGRVWYFIRRRRGKCKVFHSPIDVRLPKNGETADDEIFTVVQPDIVVVCDPSKIDEKGVIGAPCTTYDIVYTPDAKIPVHTVKGLKISLKELFED